MEDQSQAIIKRKALEIRFLSEEERTCFFRAFKQSLVRLRGVMRRNTTSSFNFTFIFKCAYQVFALIKADNYFVDSQPNLKLFVFLDFSFLQSPILTTFMTKLIPPIEIPNGSLC